MWKGKRRISAIDLPRPNSFEPGRGSDCLDNDSRNDECSATSMPQRDWTGTKKW